MTRAGKLVDITPNMDYCFVLGKRPKLNSAEVRLHFRVDIANTFIVDVVFHTTRFNTYHNKTLL